MRKLIFILFILICSHSNAQGNRMFHGTLQAESGGYSPPPITSGLAYDYDPDFGVTLSGGYVSSVASQQSSNDITNSSPDASNPIVITNNAINGYSVIDYTSVPASMNVGLAFTSSISGEHTIFIVGSYSYAGEVVISKNDLSTYMINRADKFCKSDATPTKAYTPAAGTFYTWTAYQTSGGNSAVAVNDVFGSEVASTLSYDKVGGFGFSNGYTGKIARVIIYSTKLSTGDITTVNNYLKARYGHY